MIKIIPVDSQPEEGEQANHFYARLFRDKFIAQFNDTEASGESSFSINRDQMDAFVIENGLTDAYIKDGYSGTRIAPTAISDKMRWTQLRYDSNSVRAQINDVAAHGAYGDPPYEIIAIKGSKVIKVRLTADIISLTGAEMVKTISKYLTTKNKSLTSHSNKWAERIGELPPELRVQVNSIDRQIGMALGLAATVINNSAIERDATFKDVQTYFNTKDQKLLDGESELI